MCTSVDAGDTHSRSSVIDTTRFLLIFAIYVFHTETAAGKLYPFFGRFHVAAFFILSGFWALNRVDNTVIDFVRNACRKYLLSWFVWVCIYTGFYAISDGLGMRESIGLFVHYFSAIRATGIWGMWFTPAFFFVCFLYFLLSKLLLKLRSVTKDKLPLINCAISFVLYFLFRYVLGNPQGLIFSLSFVPEYMFYYALGAVIYKVIFPLFSARVAIKKQKYYLFAFGAVSVAYTAAVYFQKESVIWRWTTSFANGMLTFLPETICVLFALSATAVAARLIGCGFLANLGKSSLGLCHAEALTKKTIVYAGSLCGLSITPKNPIEAVLFVLLALVIGHGIILPITERISSRLLSERG